MKPIVLIGGGGHCKSVIEAIESSSRTVFGILDVAENIGNEVLGYKIMGTDDDITTYARDCEFLITVGHIKNSSVREKIDEKIKEAKGTLAIVVARTANVSEHAKLNMGTVVLHGAMVNAGAIIGVNCIINTLANVEHDVVVGDFCHISTGAMINGNCKVGSRTFLGSQSVMLNGIEICESCVIAAGSFVRKSIKETGIYSGNPAILMRRI